MSKQSSQFPIVLNSVFNGVVNSILNDSTMFNNSDSSNYLYYEYTSPEYDINSYRHYRSRRWNDYWDLINNYSSYSIITTPSYPVSNYSVDENLNSIIEIAVSGFSENEISINREDLKLIVKGEKSDNDDKRKYFYKNIACRNFKLEYEGSEKWDFEKLEASLTNGILKIVIPMKEELKPIKQTFKIK